ncbi:MAG: MFS transporter [Thiohalophilus sp.]|jgi:MFS family permease
MQDNAMSKGERRIALVLAGVFSSRMLGLFMILPVFTLYAQELKGYTLTLAGLAIGIYGLTQAMLQIPLGLLSDRIGRKPVILAGLMVFALGSVIAATSDGIWGVILGRALQGAGAIASAVLALAADLTRDEHRMKVMALIGLSIGLSFGLGMVLGPLLHGLYGVPGIFWLTAGLAVAAGGLVKVAVPRPSSIRFHRDTEVEPTSLKKVLTDSQLLRVDASIFLLHMMLMANFVVVPRLLEQHFGLDGADHWRIYLPVLLGSMLAVLPFIFLAEKKRKVKQVLVFAVGLMLVVQVSLANGIDAMAGMVFVLWLFFVAFNLLESSLPSLVAKLAPVTYKGTAMGAYTTAQFLGVFVGGAAGGWLADHYATAGVFWFNTGLAAIWLLLVITMRQPPYYSSQLLNVGRVDSGRADTLARELSAMPGVIEAVIVAEEGVAYLRVDKHKLDEDALFAYSATARG